MKWFEIRDEKPGMSKSASYLKVEDGHVKVRIALPVLLTWLLLKSDVRQLLEQWFYKVLTIIKGAFKQNPSQNPKMQSR